MGVTLYDWNPERSTDATVISTSEVEVLLVRVPYKNVETLRRVYD